MMQVVVFTYCFYRFASRNYTPMGFLPDELFDYPFTLRLELDPIPLSYLTTGQFIYAFLPRPGPETLAVMQWIVIVAAMLGILGIGAKTCAIVCFVLAAHITGLLISCNAPLEGGTLLLSLLLVLALSPRQSFYGPIWAKGLRKRERRAAEYHWPIFLAWLLIGSFYTMSGLNKLIDVGPHWPFLLHVDRWAEVQIEASLVSSSYYCEPWLAALTMSPWISLASGFAVLFMELGFLSILFLPRYRVCFVVTAIALHVITFIVSGVNFMGNSFLL
jgi:hypothetical protein